MPVTGTSAPQKTNLTRAARRSILRGQLRDNGSTIWDDATLNLCLDEALATTQYLYPRLSTLFFVSTADTLNGNPAPYLLPYDFGAFIEARSGFALADAATYPAFDMVGDLIEGQIVQLIGATPSGTNGNTPTVARYFQPTQPFAQVGTPFIIKYYADRSLWTDDSTVFDLTPEHNSPLLVDIAFYATARAAAYRYAMQMPVGAAGRDFEKQYQMALVEMERAQDMAAPPWRPLTFGSTLF